MDIEKYLKERIKTRNYQDIECINFIGKSKSYLLWEQIENLIDWAGKKVVDLGCHQGYYCFKMAKKGATVIGLEKDKDKIEIGNLISDYTKTEVDFRQWESHYPIPECDIITCLNVIHHFPNKELTLSNMKCKYGIFRVSKGDSLLVQKYFDKIREFSPEKLWKENRIILLGKRK